MQVFRGREQIEFDFPPNLTVSTVLSILFTALSWQIMKLAQSILLCVSTLAITFLSLKGGIFHKSCFGKRYSSKQDESRALEHNCSPGPVFSRCFWHAAAIYSSPGYVPGGWEAAWRETLIHSLPGQILHKPAPAECWLMSQMVQIRDSTCNLKWQICVLQTRSVVWLMTHKIHACVVHKTDACVNSDYGR